MAAAPCRPSRAPAAPMSGGSGWPGAIVKETELIGVLVFAGEQATLLRRVVFLKQIARFTLRFQLGGLQRHAGFQLRGELGAENLILVRLIGGARSVLFLGTEERLIAG
jgi:hypothetical protein